MYREKHIETLASIVAVKNNIILTKSSMYVFQEHEIGAREANP